MSESNSDGEDKQRKIILLEERNDPAIVTLSSVLKSPLGLAAKIATQCFQKENGLLSYKNDLDVLKRLGVGLESAMHKESYPIANYSSYLFAFQQFIHSSYRARQGNFAEGLIRAILQETQAKVYKKSEHQTVVKRILDSGTTNKHDIDVIASTSQENLFVQIRSRDDTGGTTAKGSLAEFLKDILRNGIKAIEPIRYVIFIWVSSSSAQKGSLITRIVDQLRDFITIEPDEMKNKLSSQMKVQLTQNITLELTYGFKEFSNILAEFSGSNEISEISNKVFTTLEDWDDLWLTYALASIELQNLAINGTSNFEILEYKLHEAGIEINNEDIMKYEERSLDIAHKLIEAWKEDTIPVNSSRDQLLYIRDLVLVKMISMTVGDMTDKRGGSDHSDGDSPGDSEFNPQKSDLPDDKFKVSFRRLVKSVPSTTYASHGMYYYPARFIPQVVRWAMDRYTNPGSRVLDPFAGSGTVCIEALITGRNATCVDLTPMLKFLIDGKTYRNPSFSDLMNKASRIVQGDAKYTPRWSKIKYWYPQEIYDVLSLMWGAYQKNADPLILLALLKTSKKFSYGDDQVPKLFKSKRKVAHITETLTKDYEKAIHAFFLDSVKRNYNYSKDFTRLYRGGKINVVADTDMMDYKLDGKYDLLITSPPYGQAHEYIRSVKLELGWLGYDDEKIRELGKHEIPYNSNVPDNEIKSETLRKYLQLVNGKVKDYAITYFKSVLYILDKCMIQLNPGGTAAIFVGNATFSGTEFPFHKIFREHFEGNGYVFDLLLEDEIVGRKLFRGRKNLSPNGMGSEYLLIMKMPPVVKENEMTTVYSTRSLF